MTAPGDGPFAGGYQALLDHVLGMEEEFVAFLERLCLVESPTEEPEAQLGVQALVADALEGLGFRIRRVRGRVSGDHLLARPRDGLASRPFQLLVGHSDTVWPMGTLANMPVQISDGRLRGPGSLDMKGGVTQAVFALRALHDLGLSPSVQPVVFMNSDEEVGSPDSRRHVVRLARRADRALVLEPALGPAGKIKTARKGVGQFRITIQGRAAHAGLAPETGVSAVLEMAGIIQQLHDLNDPANGTTVNVGVVGGGTRANVVPAQARAEVDVRVVTAEAGRRIENAIQALGTTTVGASIEVEGGMRVPPLERTPRNVQLWRRGQAVAREMGIELEEGLAGGGSDGNTTSLYAATLDGLGCVGDGAHADHEHIEILPSLERCAVLAGLLLEPSARSSDAAAG